jgi:probable HAF family extracellular repeat protein
MRALYFLSALCLSCALLAAPPVTAQTYSIKDLGIPPQTTFSSSLGINQSGQVVGYGGTLIGGIFPNPTYYFLYSDGKLTPLDFQASAIAGGESKDSGHEEGRRKLRITGISGNYAVLYEDHFLRVLGALPGDYASVGAAVNSSGEVAGTSYPLAGAEKSFLYKDGNLINLGYFPGGSGAQAFGINDFGDVVGEAFLPNNYGHAFLYSRDTLTDLGTLPGATYSVGTAINDFRQVTGYAYSLDTSFFDAFVWSNGKMIDLGVLPTGIQSQGRSINSWGEVVGLSDVADPLFAGDYPDHAFLYSKGKMHDLNDLIPPNSGWVILDAVGTNDKGEIAADGTLNGILHAILLTLDCKDQRNRNCDPCRNGQ